MNAIVTGPLVLAPDRFAAILAIGVFLLASAILSRRLDKRLDRWAGLSAIVGIVAARAGHVLMHWSSFREEPGRIPAIWQGGFDIPSGRAGVALVTVLYARSAPFAAGAVATLALAGLTGTAALQLTRATYDQQAPITRMATLDGTARSIGDFQGQPIVVNLWATWCPPCRREMPMMARVAAERRDVSFVFANQSESGERSGAIWRRAGSRSTTSFSTSPPPCRDIIRAPDCR